LRVDDPGQAVEGGRRDRLRGVGAEGRGGRCEQDEAVVEYEGVVEQAVVAGWRVDERDVDLAPAWQSDLFRAAWERPTSG
jgi:hypothetical protein